MYTQLHHSLQNNPHAEKASSLITKCVHCGFCNATCPTYQYNQNELDSPRGRIYILKQLLEQGEFSQISRNHLDRCLTCRACETTCPSGVKYSEIKHSSEQVLATVSPRYFADKLLRKFFHYLLLNKSFIYTFGLLSRIGQKVLPERLSKQLPAPVIIDKKRNEKTDYKDKWVVVVTGCVQKRLAPQIDDSLKQLLYTRGIGVIDYNNCCGLLSQHMDEPTSAINTAKHNIDNWLNYLDKGAMGIVQTASACELAIREYPLLFDKDDDYFKKATVIQKHVISISNLIDSDVATQNVAKPIGKNIAFHAPCTLQHGLLKYGNAPIENIKTLLECRGYALCDIVDEHLCCGSAGTYSLFQPKIANTLLANKITNLQSGKPDLIATANIGCLLHLRKKANIPVYHWIELI